MARPCWWWAVSRGLDELAWGYYHNRTVREEWERRESKKAALPQSHGSREVQRGRVAGDEKSVAVDKGWAVTTRPTPCTTTASRRDAALGRDSGVGLGLLRRERVEISGAGGHKTGESKLDDYRKARTYLDKLIEREESDEPH